MFLKHLSPSQGRAFLSLAVEMIGSDGLTTVGEMSRLVDIQRELGIGVGEDVEMLPVPLAADLMDDASSRRIALLELMMLSGADGKFSIHESGLLQRLSGLWQVDTLQLEPMRSWTVQYRELKTEAWTMIFGEH